MKKIADILSNTTLIQTMGDMQLNVHSICINSTKVVKGSLFIAVKGHTTDGHDFINKAIQAGAICIVCEKLPADRSNEVTYIQVAHTDEIAGVLAANFYEHPSSKLKLIGITGTNGKTTCATLMHQLFTNLGYQCGLISTVQNQIGESILPSTHTTPDAISLQALLHQMVEKKCSHVFMEVSSHAIHQHRIEGTIFTGACFTNITHDHLDYHQTFDEYIRVKKLFFDHLPKSAFAISNLDDKRGAVMLQNCKAKKHTYALRTIADTKGKIIENSLHGLHMHIDAEDVFFKMIGEFNAYNILCVYACAVMLGEEKHTILQNLSMLQGAEGRFDCFSSPKENVLGIVDYAHTPDALLNVLATINKLKHGTETIFTIIGCGGDRDKLKRPIMGLVACEHSDRVIFTSDNPRTEDAAAIIHEMEAGVAVHQRKKYVSIQDRKEAIKTACSIAEGGDIILLAGKGHEKYQEINGVKWPFDDKEVMQEMFQLLEK